jgi:hypothetical protein
MQSYIDAGRIRRAATLGSVAIGFGLLSMILSIGLAFTRPESMGLVLVTSFTGLLVSQVGIYLRNRWGRSPRMDEILDDALKGLDDRYVFIHYMVGASHALICPAGILAVCTSDLQGEARYEDGGWVHTPPPARSGRASKPRPLSEPKRQTQGEVEHLRKALTRHLPESTELPIEPLLVFVHPDSQIRDVGAPFRATHVKKLKAHLRTAGRRPTLSPAQIGTLLRSLGQAP